MKLLAQLCTLFFCGLAISASAADRHHGRGGHWHGDIRHFHQHDFGRWRGGHWVHGFHGSRSGWWWVIGPTWYWYPAPVYPYPNPYLPPPAVAIVPPPAAPPPRQYWYYCANPPGYYPYVPRCNGIWQRVPARP